MKKYLFLSFILLLVITSCATKDQIVYFDNPEQLEGQLNALDYEPIIQKNDILSVNVYSLDQDVVAPFQMRGISSSSMSGSGSNGGSGMSMGSSSSRNSSTSSSSNFGYLVSSEGFIQFPVLGRVEVAGKSRPEVEDILQNKIRKYVTDAVVSVRLSNFTVTVIGELNGVVRVDDERISMPELLATAGGIPYTGRMENILIIREVDGIKTIGRIDMTETDLFDSPFYYLKQNDIVYVEPTYRQVKSAGFIESYTGLISLFTTVFSLIVLLTR